MDEVSPRRNLGFHPKGNPGVAFDGDRGLPALRLSGLVSGTTPKGNPRVEGDRAPDDLMPPNDGRPGQVASTFGD